MLLALLDMLKGSDKGKFKEMPFNMTKNALNTFEMLKLAFISAPMLVYFHPKKKICIKIDVFGFVILAIILELDKKTSV